MTGVAIAVAVFAAVLIAHVAFSHAISVRRKERVLVAFMVAGALLYTVLFAWAGQASATIPAAIEFLTGAAAFGFLALGYVEFWSLIERSFSARILIDCSRAGETGLTREEIARSYGGGLGLDGMFQKRLEGLTGSGMVKFSYGAQRLTRRGQALAVLLRWWQLLLRLD